MAEGESPNAKAGSESPNGWPRGGFHYVDPMKTEFRIFLEVEFEVGGKREEFAVFEGNLDTWRNLQVMIDKIIYDEETLCSDSDEDRASQAFMERVEEDTMFFFGHSVKRMVREAAIGVKEKLWEHEEFHRVLYLFSRTSASLEGNLAHCAVAFQDAYLEWLKVVMSVHPNKTEKTTAYLQVTGRPQEKCEKKSSTTSAEEQRSAEEVFIKT